MGNSIVEPGIMAYDCNPSTQEAGAGGLLLCSRSTFVYKVHGLHSEFCANLTTVILCLIKFSKKRDGGMAQLVEGPGFNSPELHKLECGGAHL